MTKHPDCEDRCQRKKIGRPPIHGYRPRGKMSPTYHAWTSMRERCESPTCRSWLGYGGRGIKICLRWKEFPNFLADMGPKPTGKSLDRINNEGNYEPSNCRWATPKEQANNIRTNNLISFNGVTQSLSLWAEAVGIKRTTLRMRLTKSGWSIEKTLTTKVMANDSTRRL